MIEPMHPESKQFGTDIERISVPFKQFLESLKEDGPHPYLTTQYSEQDDDQQTVFPPPANALKEDYPIVPRIMGNLFLQQVNLWLGKSKDGSSSGLHHDFHDNLYCLLQGKKRFVLYPPQELPNLYPYGKLDNLHPNGLISYKDGSVRADGLPIRVALQTRVKAIEKQLEALPKPSKGKGKDKALSKERKALMKAHDDALDELAQYTLEAEDEGEVDDFDALMGGLDGSEDGNVRGAGPSGSTGRTQEEDMDEEDEDEELKGQVLGGDDDSDDSDEENQDESEEPSSFSRIPTAFLHKHLNLPTTSIPPSDILPDSFPNLKKTTEPYVVELNAGDMLYLPASWWHEVTSTSVPEDEGTGGVHMAFNYWFYPPTNDDFDHPYEDQLVWGYFREKLGESANQNGREDRASGLDGSSGKRKNEDSVPNAVQSKKKAKK
ncbi:cupin-like domain-containing protein [Abortiporus biennis]|nr:cupin-like domain-containing protein [Abortiporus biennis]